MIKKIKQQPVNKNDKRSNTHKVVFQFYDA